MSTSADAIVVTRNEGVARIEINRPAKRNALTGAMYLAMAEAITRANKDDDVGVIMITGQPGAFSAGNDIGDFLQGRATFETSPAIVFLKALVLSHKPLIAALDGLAIGIGTTMVLHCDLAYASARTRFHMPFIDLALVPEAAASLLVPGLCGIKTASQMLLLGEAFDAASAERHGIINAVVDGDVVAHAAAVAQRLAAKPRTALLASRALLRTDSHKLLERIDREAEAFAERLNSAEAKAIFAAFMAKA
ncbi:MAG: enoyl-CoA hydratase/isomerase family protein [Hyphomicrobiales bacterium]|nr:enoyl-CoA hydratase/isomerase family protein [Hyphomicrobiales bacterium]